MKIPPSHAYSGSSRTPPQFQENLPRFFHFSRLGVSLIAPDSIRVTAPYAYSRLRIPSVRTMREPSGPQPSPWFQRLVFTAPNAQVPRFHPSPAPLCIFTTRACLTILSLSPRRAISACAGLQPRFPRFFHLFLLCPVQLRSFLNRTPGPRPKMSISPPLC